MYCKAIPSYVKSFKRQYICLLGINQDFGHLHKDLYYTDVAKGSLKKREVFIDRLYNYIKKIWRSCKIWIF